MREVDAATAALSHARYDVQQAAVALIERHRRVLDDELRKTQQSLEDGGGGSLRQRLTAMP